MRHAIASALVLAALLAAPFAHAGPAKVHDTASILSGADTAAVSDAAAKSPFEVHVLTASLCPDKPAFEASVGRAVTAPNVLAIGVCSHPGHRTVTVMYGGTTGIPAGNGGRLSQVPVTLFKAGNFGQGIGAVIDAAAQMRAVAPVAVSLPAASQASPPQTVVVHTTAQVAPPIETDSGHPWLWSLFFLSLITGSAVWVVRRRNRQALAFEESVADNVLVKDGVDVEVSSTPYSRDYRRSSSPPMGRRSYAPSYRPSYSSSAPAYRPSVTAPTTVIHTGGSNSGDLATGILLGQALSGPRVIERDVVREVERPLYAPSVPSSASWDTPSRAADPDPSPGASWDSSPSRDPDPTPSSNWDSSPSDSSSDSSSSFDSSSSDSSSSSADW